MLTPFTAPSRNWTVANSEHLIKGACFLPPQPSWVKRISHLFLFLKLFLCPVACGKRRSRWPVFFLSKPLVLKLFPVRLLSNRRFRWHEKETIKKMRNKLILWKYIRSGRKLVELAGDFDSNQLTILLLSPFKCMIKQTKLSPSLKTKTIETCQSQTDRQRITGKQLNLLNVDVFYAFRIYSNS